MGSRDVSCQIGLLIARYRVIHGGKINIRLDGVGERQGSLERRRVVDDIDFPTFAILTMTLSLFFLVRFYCFSIDLNLKFIRIANNKQLK